MNLLTRLSISLGMGCLCAAPMFADTFTAYTLSDANARNLIGVDAAGDVLIYNINANQYETYVGGSLSSTSVNQPAFKTQNGSACSAPAGSGGTAICDGSREVYDVKGSSGDAFYEIYPGSSAAGDLFYTGDPFDVPTAGTFATSVALDGNGDFVYVDARDEEIREFVDTAVSPEPSSLLLLATGVMGATALVRRRFQAAAGTGNMAR